MRSRFIQAIAGLVRRKRQAEPERAGAVEQVQKSVMEVCNAPIIRPKLQQQQISRISSRVKNSVSSQVMALSETVKAEVLRGQSSHRSAEMEKGGYEIAEKALNEIDGWFNRIFDCMGKQQNFIHALHVPVVLKRGKGLSNSPIVELPPANLNLQLSKDGSTVSINFSVGKKAGENHWIFEKRASEEIPVAMLLRL